MSSIPLPALAVQPPQQQASPLDQYQKLLSLKSLMQQRQIQQQLAPLQIQEAQQQVQKGQYELGQTQAVNQAYRDALTVDESGHPSIDQDKLSKSLAGQNYGSAIPGILKNTADYEKSFADASKAHADAAKAQQEVQTSFQDAMGSAGAAMKAANYDPNMADLLLQHQMQMPGIPQQYAQRLQQIDQMIRQNPQSVKQIADQLIQTSPKQQQMANEQEVARIRASGSPESRELNDYLENNPGKTAQDFMAFKTQQNLAAQNSPEAVQGAARKAAAEEAARVAQENSPAAIAGAAAKASAVQKATSGGSLAPLSDVPPHLVAPAAAAANKAGEDFTMAQQATDDMNTMLELAKKGNKVAYAYSPVTGVLQINVAGQIKRMNMPEIESYGGAGSALDKIKGFLGKQATGASIPPDVLSDMGEVANAIGGNATKTYQRKLDVVNSTYGSKFQVPSSLKSQNASSGMVTMKAPNGQTKEVSADQVEHYKSLGATVVQ